MIIQIEPWIDNEELDQLKRLISSTFVVEHELTKEFEGLTASYTNAQYAIAVTNGTMALFCCLKALDIGPGDEVIVPNMTFIASANAVIMSGAMPVFCEADPRTFCIDPSHIEQHITKRTKAIMPVHLYGQSANMEAVMAIAKKHHLRVIEDAAQGVGVRFNGQHVGTFGDCGVLSYYGNKTITCGEGGVILTNNEDIAKKCYRLKNHGRDKKGTFIHDYIGYNFSFTEMQAAIGIAQMQKLSRILDKKQRIYNLYMQHLSNVNGLQPVHIDERCQPVYWFTSFMATHLDSLSEFLLKHKIQTRRFFYPLNLQPCYKDIVKPGEYFPVSQDIYSKGISLPSSYSLSEKDQLFVIEKIKAFYEDRH